MQRIFGTILLSLFGVLFLAPDAFSAWKIDKFKTGTSGNCFIDKHGNYAYWFCGEPSTKWCCNGLCHAAGQYILEMKQSEVLSMTTLQAGEPDINDENLGGRYICCHKNFKTDQIGADGEVKKENDDGSLSNDAAGIWKTGTALGTNGEFRLNENVKKTLTKGGKKCVQEYTACGNKVGECVALCGNDDEVEVNGTCHKKCLPGEAYESKDSLVCVSCPTGPRQKIVSAPDSEGGYEYCLQCSNDEFIKGNKCENKNDTDKFSRYGVAEIVACWKCAYSDTILKECLGKSGEERANYIKTTCKFKGY